MIPDDSRPTWCQTSGGESKEGRRVANESRRDEHRWYRQRKNTNSPRWSQMIQAIQDDPRWYQMIPDEMISDDSSDDPRWSQMIPDDPRWPQMIPDDPRWSQTQMILDEPSWFQMIQDDPRWSQTRWSQMIPDPDDPSWSLPTLFGVFRLSHSLLWATPPNLVTRPISIGAGGTSLFLRTCVDVGGLLWNNGEWETS